ncbi:DMT family transporter [Phreatobacter stygius]|uniref:DMT family transporter n=1 Tax=Phreatobacter stygius TaxID=1940610 RepID=A0A4D7B387_9HYPH|nr:DMT family transporter [Phreatobacter stygius]QCI65513.1 DMT family transporter [Phreatobacter stygius]
MTLGILAGLAAGALWGLTFVAPLMVAPFKPMDLVILRTLVFGLVSLALLASRGFRDWRDLPAGMSWTLVLLGAAGFNVYFGLIALAIPLVGTSIVALIIGALPVAMAIGGNRGTDRLSFRRLLPPLTAIALGLAIVNGAAFGETPEAGRPGILLGVALAVGGFASWYWYGMRNAAVLRQGEVAADAVGWTALTGTATLATLPLLIAIAWAWGLSAAPSIGLAVPALGPLVAWSLMVGLASSFLATWLWSIASTRLPVSLAAQLIVSETLFGLTYGFIHAGRWPSLAEAAAIVLMVGGVVGAIRAFTR